MINPINYKINEVVEKYIFVEVKKGKDFFREPQEKI